MKVSVEISYYPLNSEYIPPIKNLIDRLKATDGLEIKPNTMSTQVFGDYDLVMDTLKKELKESARLPHSVFVMKLVNADLS